MLLSVRIGTEEEEEDDDDDDDDDDDSVRAVAVVFSRALWPPPSPVPVAIRPSCIPTDRQTGVPPPARRPRAHALLSKHLHTLLRALALFLTPVYLSVCPRLVLFLFIFVRPTEPRELDLLPSFFLSVSLPPSLFLFLSHSLLLALLSLCMFPLCHLLSFFPCAHALAVLLSFYYYAPRAGQRRLSVPKLHRLFQPNISILHNSDITHARGKMSPARIINLLSAGSKKIER